jgi:hypothetical protein
MLEGMKMEDVARTFDTIDMEAAASEITSQFSDIAQSAELAQPVLDEDRRIIFMNVSGTDVTGRSFDGMVAMFLGRRHIISVNVYFNEGVPGLADTFDAFVAGFTWHEGEQFVPHTSDLLQRVVVGALIGALVAGIITLIRRVRKAEKAA